MSPIRVILLGHGYLGKWHAQKLAASTDCEFVAIIEPRREAHAELGGLYPTVQVVSSLEELTEDFDAALIASPTSYHFDLCQKLLAGGKHIFCEKPVCVSSEEAAELIGMKEAHPELIFQVGHSERFHAFFAADELKHIRNFFKGNVLLRLERQAPFKGRATDVDVVSDLMIHDLDLLLYLTGEVPVSLSASGHKVLTSKWDVVEARLKFASGKVASIVVGRTYTKEVRFFEAIGPLGTLHFDLKDEKRATFTKESGLIEQEFSRRDHLLLEQQAFFKAIATRTPPPVTLEDGELAVKLVNLVLKSLETGEELSL